MATSMISSSQKESIFMNMSDGVILMNDQHEITYLNPAAEGMKKLFPATDLPEIKAIKALTA